TRSAFNGVNSTISALNIPGVGNVGNKNGSSANVSSTASDNYGEMFELEQDVISEQSRSMRDPTMLKPGMSIEGLSHKMAEISMGQTQPAGTNQSISSVSAIARPSN
ncbi:hypothetical protein IW150_004583, partial [Coemansia sp. RSA 2607]